MPQALISFLTQGTVVKISPNSRSGSSSHPSSPSCVHSWTCEALGLLLRPTFTAGIFLLPGRGKSTHLRICGLSPPCCQQTIPSQGDLQREHDGDSSEGPRWCWHTVGTQSPLPLAVPAAAVLRQRRGWDGNGSREHGVAHRVRLRLLRAAVQPVPLLCFLSRATSVTGPVYNQETQEEWGLSSAFSNLRAFRTFWGVPQYFLTLLLSTTGLF